ncbi:uncharacterized protein LOC142560408 isoform X3 [Dermacentor variabilis]|uniref:uncharacterized protein LOC142560408 isoform X3 n=1 Tax=Dermacentor variabilis TaxID=34621 RepID=UPI003F5BED2D
MDRLTHAPGSICFILLSNMVNGDNDFLEKMRDDSWPLPAILIIAIMVVLSLLFCVISLCACYRRRQRLWAMTQSSPCMPLSLGPAPIPGPVMSGAASHTHPEARPLMLGASTYLISPNTEQRGFQEERCPPYSKDGFYSDHVYPQPPKAPVPSAPHPPLPPYN